MSSLTRPLTDKELAAAGIEPAPIAHETFTQVFAVHEGKLKIVTEDADDAECVNDPEAPEDTAPASKRIAPAVAIWCLTYSAAIGALIAAAVTR